MDSRTLCSMDMGFDIGTTVWPQLKSRHSTHVLQAYHITLGHGENSLQGEDIGGYDGIPLKDLPGCIWGLLTMAC